MNLSDRKCEKHGSLCLLLFFFMALLTVMGCKGDGDSSSYTMREYFPLSSGWETDKWTLFVDENEFMIDGVSTLAMVDTREAEANFWTNDDNGLRLHGAWNSETQGVTFSQPVLLADAVSKVGDRNQTIYTRDSEQLVFSAELIGLENITTTAGTFNNCLKLRIHVYPVGSIPDDYGYETLWLARNVGFVKAQNDANSYLHLFAKQGETRELISYYLTPPELFDEEQAVRQAYTQWNNYLNAGNITDITNMLHDGYYEKCKNKAAAVVDWNNFFDDSDDYNLFMSIEDVDIIGDEAYVLREYQESYLDLLTTEPTRRWGRSTVRLKQDAFGEWKIYGNQLDVYPSFASVYPRVTPSSTTFAAPVEITDCATDDWPDTDDQIASLTLTGPPESEIVDFEIPWDPITGWKGFWWEFDIARAKSGFHTFEVIDVNGNSVLYTDYLQPSTPLEMPLLVNPADSATGVPTNVTFEWAPVAGANSYKLRVYEDGGGPRVVNITTDQTTYTAATLDPAMTYEWQVRAKYIDPNDGDADDDGAEYDSESRSSYLSFTTAP
jgi:hypothetical protein